MKWLIWMYFFASGIALILDIKTSEEALIKVLIMLVAIGFVYLKEEK